MKAMASFLKFDLKSFFRLKNVIIMTVLLALLLYFLQSGINHHKKMVDAKKVFQEIERLKIDQYPNYTYYGSVGFRLLFIPNASTILFSNAFSILQTTAHIDCGDVLNIYNSSMGENTFTDKPGGYANFSGIILLFGGILAVFFGYLSLNQRQYLKFLSSMLSAKKVFLTIILSRIIIMISFLALTACCSWLLALFNNISPAVPANTFSYLLYFLFLMTGVLVFFYSAGTALASLKSKTAGHIICAAVWFVSVFVIPWGVHTIVSKQARQLTSNYKVEMKKLDLLMGFENSAVEKEGKMELSKRNNTEERDLIEDYWSKDFKRIQSVDERHELDMRIHIRYYQKLSLLFPTTFYLSAARSLSGSGYENVADFYKYARETKYKFVRYYLDKKFYTNDEKVTSFIKGDENLYTGKIYLPGYMGIGSLLIFIYPLLLFILSYVLFRRNIYGIPGKRHAGSKLPDLRLVMGADTETPSVGHEKQAGEYRVLTVKNNRAGDVFYNVFSGQTAEAVKKGYKGKIFINGKDVTQEPVTFDFLYLCHPSDIPGHIKVGDLFGLLSGLTPPQLPPDQPEPRIKEMYPKQFKQLQKLEKFDVLLSFARLKKSRIYLIDNITRDMEIEAYIGLRRMMEKLSSRGSLLLNLTREELIIPLRIKNNSEYNEDPRWSKVVATYSDTGAGDEHPTAYGGTTP